jgi:MraZ protein
VDEKLQGTVIMAEPPRTIGQATVDPKGRLKLPSQFLDFLRKLGVVKVYMTTVDMRSARLYPISEWLHNENLLATQSELSEEAEEVAYLAKFYGDDSPIDEQGRVLVPQELRRKLGLEGKPVYLDWYKGRINVAGKEIHDERLTRAEINLAEKVKKLEKVGLR